MIHEWNRDSYQISTDPDRLDITTIQRFLSEDSYWAAGRSEELVRRSIRHSIAFGLYEDARQLGFCRVLTDYVSLAWLGDVFVLDEARGRGLGKWLVGSAMSHPDLQNIRRWLLATRDAHGLYRQFGFEVLPAPERFMEKMRR